MTIEQAKQIEQDAWAAYKKLEGEARIALDVWESACTQLRELEEEAQIQRRTGSEQS